MALVVIREELEKVYLSKIILLHFFGLQSFLYSQQQSCLPTVLSYQVIPESVNSNCVHSEENYTHFCKMIFFF